MFDHFVGLEVNGLKQKTHFHLKPRQERVIQGRANHTMYISIETLSPLASKQIHVQINNNNTIEKGSNMFKVNNKNTRRRSGVFIVNFEYISHLF